MFFFILFAFVFFFEFFTFVVADLFDEKVSVEVVIFVLQGNG